MRSCAPTATGLLRLASEPGNEPVGPSRKWHELDGKGRPRYGSGKRLARDAQLFPSIRHEDESCYEKFIIDIELLKMLQVEFTPLEITEESLAFGAHEEIGHGGHFLGAAHTMERFRDCFYRPMLSSTANFEAWIKPGSKDTAARADEIWRAKLDTFEPPPWTTPSAPSSMT